MHHRQRRKVTNADCCGRRIRQRKPSQNPFSDGLIAYVHDFRRGPTQSLVGSEGLDHASAYERIGLGDDRHASMSELSQIVGDQLARAAEVKASARREAGTIRSIHADAGQALNAAHLPELGWQATPQKTERADAAT